MGLILLLVFAIVPQALIKAPELSGDLAYWFGMNFGIAALCEWVPVAYCPMRHRSNRCFARHRCRH